MTEEKDRTAPDVERVIAGLEYCTGPMAKCGYCPYHSGDEMPNSLDDCGILKDAIELLKEHKPKVLTREELKQFVDHPCWFESHGTYMGKKGFWIIPYMFTCYETMYYVYPLMQINDRGDCHFSELGFGAYNKAWRCWSAQPTEEQRKAVKWDE